MIQQSVYADIGFTLGNYFLDRFSQQLKEDGDKIVDVTDMVIEKASIAENTGPQFLRVAAELDWSSKVAAVRYYSVDVILCLDSCVHSVLTWIS